MSVNSSAQMVFVLLHPRRGGPGLGCTRQLLRSGRKAIDSARHCPPQPPQLNAGTVMTHADVVDDAFHRLFPVPQFALSAAAPVDLVIAVPPGGKRAPVG